MKPMRMPAIPSPRANTTRGRLPLQMVHLIKFGWACLRRENSTFVTMLLKADGCVVC